VAEQSVLQVLFLQGLPEQRVVAQIDRADGQVLAGAPVGVNLFQGVLGEWAFARSGNHRESPRIAGKQAEIHDKRRTLSACDAFRLRACATDLPSGDCVRGLLISDRKDAGNEDERFDEIVNVRCQKEMKTGRPISEITIC
jgi:hypothetical protein